MKTITEFDGFKLNQALVQFKEIMGVAKPAPKGPKAKIIAGKKDASAEVATTTEAAAPSEAASTTEATENTPSAETAAPVEAAASAEAPAENTEAAPAADAPAQVSAEEKLKTVLGEAYKMEGEKLEHFINALKCISRKNQHLKRVVVMTLAEGEKAPQHAEKIGETHYFLAEYFPAPARKDDSKNHGPRDGKGRGDKRGKGKGGRGGPGRGDKREGAGRGNDRGGPGRGDSGRSDQPREGGGRGPRGPGRAPTEKRDPNKPVTLPQPRP